MQKMSTRQLLASLVVYAVLFDNHCLVGALQTGY
jgi:hypothetical protein